MSFAFPVDAGHILMFRRAIGDAPDIDGSLESISMSPPPTFVAAAEQFDPESRLRPSAETWVGSRDRNGSRGRAFHAEEHLEYHKPYNAGDLLTVTHEQGDTWQKKGTHGNLTFTERVSEFRDEQGELVVRVRRVRVEVS